MADHQHDAVEGLEASFEILDHRHVEMVGRLVHKQDRGLACKGPGERGAPLLPARKGCRVGVLVHAEFHDLRFGHVDAVQAFGDVVEDAGMT